MYNYQTEKQKIFTEEGQEMFLKIRDEQQQSQKTFYLLTDFLRNKNVDNMGLNYVFY